jgi:uncharacterized membrane-anchored protein
MTKTAMAGAPASRARQSTGWPSWWLAYILTRPLGASIGDEMSQSSHRYGGLGLGTTGTSYIFLGCILALVTYLSVTRRDATEIGGLAVPEAA